MPKARAVRDPARRGRWQRAAAVLVLMAAFAAQAAAPPGWLLDPDEAMRTSQAAIGQRVGDYRFTDAQGRSVALAALRGRPLVVSFIYTSCATTCSLTTRHLAQAVEAARAALGRDSFAVLTVGFDSAHDTPAAMASFARRQGVAPESWYFLSADAATVERLTRDLGFLYEESPRGFDHLTQASLIDAQGRVHTQIYGDLLYTPALVEPLKALVLGTSPDDGLLTAFTKRVRLYCTAYDPVRDRYYFDYSLFIGLGIGLLIIGSAAAFLLRERQRARVLT